MLRILSVFVLVLSVCSGFAQENPDRRYLFTSNQKEDKKRRETLRKSILTSPAAGSEDLNVKAPRIEYQSDGKTLVATGGMLITRGNIKAQAQQGTINSETKDADLSGNVIFSGNEGIFDAKSAKINFDSETGEFTDLKSTFDESGYAVESEKMFKLSEFEYELKDSEFTTCHCPDGEKPWSFSSRRCNITQEGYGHSYDNWLKFDGNKVLYLPYLGFPAKTERASGLLAPTWAFSGPDGFIYKQPLFLNLTESADLTVTPFTYSRTRSGTSLGGRFKFSQDDDLDFRVIYSDESARFPYDPVTGEGLRGLQTSTYHDPKIDRNRVGFFMRQRWSSDPDWLIPTSFFSDLHYVSDDLMPRELVDDEMVAYQALYATSTVAMQNTLGASTTFGVASEYNQALEKDDDDLMLQRIPQLSLNNFESFRPFGFNALGLKLVSRSRAGSELLRRDEGYDGWRSNLNPAFSVPFHVKNYFNGALNLGAHRTFYSQTSTTLAPGLPVLAGQTKVDEHSTRNLYNVGFDLASGVERVYRLDDDSWLKDVTGLGSGNRGLDLKRIKHTVEPFVSWNLVPGTSQTNEPFYDSFDHVHRRSFFNVGLSSAIWGRFMPREGSRDELLELTPELSDLPMIDQTRPLQSYGVFNSANDPTQPIALRNGEARQLALFQLVEGYDYFSETDDDRTTVPWTSTTFRTLLSPSRYFALNYEGLFNFERTNIDAWNFGTSIRDDRGDTFRTRYTYVDNPGALDVDRLSQIEGNVEAVLTDKVNLGYYQRYNENTSDTLERGVAVRFHSACRCWSFDIGAHERHNPNKTVFLATFTFAGLGDISQSLLTQREDTQP